MSEPQQERALSAEGLRLKNRIEISSFSIRSGQCVVLCGPNGSGKSSFLRLLAGLESDYSGTVRLGGRDLKRMSRRDIAENLAWLPQRPHLSESVSCLSLVAAARFRFGESPLNAEKQASRTLKDQGIAHLATRLSSQVSGGELQRVLIAALAAQEAPILLVDEPANHLDPRHQVSTYEHLGKLWRDEGKAVIVVSHDVRLAQLLGPAEAVRVLGIQKGRCAFETHLNAPDLAETLGRLYETKFVDARHPGGLAVDLSSTHSFRTAPR